MKGSLCTKNLLSHAWDFSSEWVENYPLGNWQYSVLETSKNVWEVLNSCFQNELFKSVLLEFLRIITFQKIIAMFIKRKEHREVNNEQLPE